MDKDIFQYKFKSHRDKKNRYQRPSYIQLLIPLFIIEDITSNYKSLDLIKIDQFIYFIIIMEDPSRIIQASLFDQP